MSRIGNAPITVPAGVKVNITTDFVEVEGPKGQLQEKAQPGIDVRLDEGVIKLGRTGDDGAARARHGLLRALIANAMTGVTVGFKKELEIVGVGYRGEVKGKTLTMALGFSHPALFEIPEGISVEIDKQNKITVAGASKQAVGQAAAEIRSLRKPDVYKGKGIRYVGEYVRIKEGKSSGT